MTHVHRTPRTPAAAAFVAALVLALALTGCGGDNDAGNVRDRPQDGADTAASKTPGASTSAGNDRRAPESTGAPTITPDGTGKFDYCKNQEPFTGEAADEFGAAEVADAYCTMVTLQMEQSFLEDHLRNDGDVLKPIDFSIWTRYMTAKTREEFTETVETALGGDQDAKSDVWALTFFDALSGSNFEFTDEPAVLNPTFSAATTDIDEVDGRKRLLLTFDVFADLNVVKENTTKPFIVPIARRITLALIDNPVPTNDENDWLISGYNGNFTVDKPIKRTAEYLSDAAP